MTAVSFDDGLRNRVAGVALGQCGDVQKHVFRNGGSRVVTAGSGMDGFYGKNTSGDGAGLIKNEGVDLRKGFQVIAAFDQYSAAACGTDSAEETEGDGNHQCAGAGDYEEYKAAVKASGHSQIRKDHADHGDEDSQDHDCGSVPAGKAGNKFFRTGFLIRAVFHQLQDLGDSTVFVGRSGHHLDGGSQVDGTRKNTGAGSGINGSAFTCQGSGIEGRSAFHDLAVDRYFFTGTDKYDFTDLHFLGIHFFFGSVTKDDSAFRADIHEVGNGLTAFSDGNALEKFSQLIEKHNRRGFRIFTYDQCAEGGDHHEKFLIEKVALSDLSDTAPDDVISDEKIGDQVRTKIDPPVIRKGQEMQHDQKDGGGDNSE